MKKLLKVLGLSLLSLSLVACGSGQTHTSTSNQAHTEQEAASETLQEEGKEDTTSSASKKEQSQERMIIGSVALVKILDALGLASDIVGVPTTSYTLPESVESAAEIGSPMTPDMEVMLSLEPTIIVALESLGEDYKTSFSSQNIETLLVDLSSYEALKETITVLGKRFEKEAEAEAILAEFASKEEEITKQIEGKESPEVMILFGAPGNFMMATDKSYVGNLLNLVGGTNIIKETSSSFIPVNMEYLAGQNPDVILTMSHASPETMKAIFEEEFATNEMWQHFDAVKEGRVINLDSNYFGMSADLLALDAMSQLVEILYS